MPVFWACGVTPQAVVMESRPELAITHAPGHMLITDARDSLCNPCSRAPTGTATIVRPPERLGGSLTGPVARDAARR